MSLPYTEQDWIILKLYGDDCGYSVIRGPVPTQELRSRLNRILGGWELEVNKASFLIFEDKRIVIVTEPFTAEQIEALQGEAT